MAPTADISVTSAVHIIIFRIFAVSSFDSPSFVPVGFQDFPNFNFSGFDFTKFFASCPNISLFVVFDSLTNYAR